MESLKITWKNKRLWWLGFFVTLGSVGQGFSYTTDAEKNGSIQMEKVSDFIQANVGISIAIAGAALVIFLGLLALRIFSQAALIRTLADLPVFATMPVKSLLKEGRHFFWRILGIDILLVTALLLVLLALSMPVFFLASLKSNILAAMVAGVALLIFLPLAVMAYFVHILAYPYAVIADFGVRKSLEAAYLLWRSNMGKSIIVALILGLIGFAFLATVIMALILLAIPFAVAGALSYLMFAQSGLFAIIGIGIVVLLAALLGTQSVLAVFSQCVWVLFFKQRAMHKAPREDSLKKEKEAVLTPAAQPEVA